MGGVGSRWHKSQKIISPIKIARTGYRPVTAEAKQAYKDWKKEQAQQVQLTESAGALPRAPAGTHDRNDTYLTDPYMLAPEESAESGNWVVREERAPIYTVNLANVREPDPDTPRAEKYKGSYLRSGLTDDEYRALKDLAEQTLETVDAQDADATHAPTLLTGSSFDAIFAQGSVPPDPIVAVGPNHIVAMVNSRVSIWTYDAAGNATFQQTFDVDAFFGAPPSVPNCGLTFDPFVDYDEAEDRFVIGMDNLVGANPDSYYCVAASATNDPTGSWHRTVIRSDGSDTSTWSDFPHMGIGLEAIYIVGNMFADGGGFQLSRAFALNKNDLYNGNAVQTAEDTFAFFTVQPVKLHGFSSGGWPAPGTPVPPGDIGDEVYFVLRVFDEKGRFDETHPRRLPVTGRKRRPDSEDGTSIEDFANLFADYLSALLVPAF